MKKLFILLLTVSFGFPVFGQQLQLNPNLKFEKPPSGVQSVIELPETFIPGTAYPVIPSKLYKSTDVVSIVSIGTSGNAFGYGWAGGQRSLVCVNEDLNMVTNFHRMGGALDPGGFSGDLGYDVSIDEGETWTNMNECYTVSDGWGIYYESARYPQHGIFNPPGNIDPDEAYIVFFAPVLDGSNSPDTWGGYCYGRAKIGDLNDTTKHLVSSNPGAGIYQNIPDGFTVTSTGDFWVVDVNLKLITGEEEWLEELIISHGVWDETEEDYVLSQFLLPCPTQDSTFFPLCSRVEFSPDGQYGYIAVLADNGSVEISTDQSLYPILWRTDDYGESWSEPIAVPIAGEYGIVEVQEFLSDDEIEELYEFPYPDRDEIPFTTAYDFDLSVDGDGNPHIAVIVGVTGDEPYYIITGISPSSHYMYTAAFLLSSLDKGEWGSWLGYELGRPVSFRGNFGDLTEDNRIQIARSYEGDKMFVSWLDTDTTVSAENNAPDIWARGVDIVNHATTYNYELENHCPQNMSYGSEATFSAYFFVMANQVFYLDDLSAPVYILPYVYENMSPFTPEEFVEFKYIQDAFFWEAQFSIGSPFPNIHENKNVIAGVSEFWPNPATKFSQVEITLTKPAVVQINVSNLSGQIVHKFPDQSCASGLNTLKLDISDLNPGVYFIRIEVGREAFSRKIIVE